VCSETLFAGTVLELTVDRWQVEGWRVEGTVNKLDDDIAAVSANIC